MKNGPYNLVVPPEDYPGKRYRNKNAYEHIVEFWKKEGRMPLDGHVVHHADENKRNNSWENLIEITRSEHTADHSKKPITHGLTGYRRKCRCDVCKAAQREIMRKYRSSFQAPEPEQRESGRAV